MDPKTQKKVEACLKDAKRIEAQLFRSQAAASRLAARMSSVSKHVSDNASFTSAAAGIEECRTDVIEAIEFMAVYWNLPSTSAESAAETAKEVGKA